MPLHAEQEVTASSHPRFLQRPIKGSHIQKQRADKSSLPTRFCGTCEERLEKQTWLR